MTRKRFRSVLLAVRDEMLAQMREEGFFYHGERHFDFFRHGERRFDPTAWDINNGHCEQWADSVYARLPKEWKSAPAGAVPYAWCCWLDELSEVQKRYGFDEDSCDYPPGVELPPGHFVLVVGSRYFDAECIEGTDDVFLLPIFLQRTRDEALAAETNTLQLC